MPPFSKPVLRPTVSVFHKLLIDHKNMNTTVLTRYVSHNILAFLFLALVICGVAQAQAPQNLPASTPSTTQNTTVQNSRIAETDKKAQQWNLQPEEWQRYQELMNGPLGIYSPGLDPLTALGISARSDEERRRYARLQVMAETQRVERELAYQRAYDQAFKEMYPDLLPIAFETPVSVPAQTSSAVLQGNKRLAVFVRDNCKLCDVKVKQLQQSGTGFDLYMVGSKQEDVAIRRWATTVGIDPQKVFSREITLNHDAGRWQSLGISGDLPAVVKEVGGKWQRQ